LGLKDVDCSNAHWDEAVTLTENLWKEKGLGVKGSGLLNRSSPLKKSTANIDRRKALKTVYHQVEEFCMQDDLLYDSFMLSLNTILEQELNLLNGRFLLQVVHPQP